ncbi:MAG: alpha/beta hydrolase [Chloroflexi bacterium]|nr:alpha/beta hydrolase [Chloroflexota bacterium]MBU1662048.1 alpha/beta hydrolase [Chloroflexota bacterium]
MSAIILQGELVHYEVLGHGRPVIFLHGWVGSWRYWIPSMQTASIEFRSYALDMWGFGDTAKSSERYLLSYQLDLLNNFHSEMGMRKIAIVGHGLGAVVGLLFAEQFPDKVDRIMAIELPLETQSISPRFQHSSPTELAEWLLRDTPETQAARMEAPKADGDAILRSLDNLRSARLTELTNRMTTPCLLVHGLNDPAIAIAHPDRLAALPPQMHHISFDSSGHFPMLDQPNKFHSLMSDFLSLASGESPGQLQLKEEWKRRVR